MNSIKLYIFAIMIVLFAAINSISISFFERNLIADLSFKNETIFYVIYAVICMSILYVGLDRDTYVRPLGMAFIPGTAFKEYKQKKTNQSLIININDPKADKVVYWASNPSSEIADSPKIAYDKYENYGIAKVIDGKATLLFNCPSKYVVNHFGIGKLLDKHLHYRIINKNSAVVSSIKTIKLDC